VRELTIRQDDDGFYRVAVDGNVALTLTSPHQLIAFCNDWIADPILALHSAIDRVYRRPHGEFDGRDGELGKAAAAPEGAEVAYSNRRREKADMLSDRPLR